MYLKTLFFNFCKKIYFEIFLKFKYWNILRSILNYLKNEISISVKSHVFYKFIFDCLISCFLVKKQLIFFNNSLPKRMNPFLIMKQLTSLISTKINVDSLLKTFAACLFNFIFLRTFEIY